MASAKLVFPAGDLKILILGESGVGKSTLINAIANYLCYDDLQSALNSQLQYPATNNSDKANCQSQGLRCCKIPLDADNVLHLYDTTELFNWTHLSEIPSLNAICILLNPEVSANFNQLMDNMLSTFDMQSCKNNIIFVVTKTFKPSAVLNNLKNYIENYNSSNGIKIPICNIFYINNLSFCLLSKLESRGGDLENDITDTSWNEASTVTKRILMNAISLNLIPIGVSIGLHVAKGILNNGYRLLTALDHLQDNLQMLHDLPIEDEQRLFIPVIDVIQSDKSPATICTGDNCKEILKVQNVKKYVYKYCHSPCDCGTKCSIISINDQCVRCKCSQSFHIRIPRVLDWVFIQEPSQPLYQPNTCDDYNERNFTMNIETREYELYSESTIILDILGILTTMLKNRKVPHENGWKSFLGRQIQWECQQKEEDLTDYRTYTYNYYYNRPINLPLPGDYDLQDALFLLRYLRGLKHSGKLLQFEDLPPNETFDKYMEVGQNGEILDMMKMAVDEIPKFCEDFVKHFFKMKNALRLKRIQV